MQSCLKSCGDCASAKNLPGWRRTGTRKSRAPSGVPFVMLGVQTSTKPRLVHRAADRADDRVVEAEVPLHAVAAHVEVAVLEAQHLVDVLADLERERLGARDDRQRVDLDLDLARREVRIHGVGRAQHDLPFRLEDELAADLVRERGRIGGALGVDHELHLPGEVAQVDEDEPAVVAARVGPAGELDALAGIGGAERAARRVAPAAHEASFSRSSSACTSTSCSPRRRSAIEPSRKMTMSRAPDRCACVS